MDKVGYEPIGVIHSPFGESKGVPIQPLGRKGIKSTVELEPQYKAGLKDLAHRTEDAVTDDQFAP